MTRFIASITSLLIAVTAYACPVTDTDVQNLPAHPRLLMSIEDEDAIRETIRKDMTWAMLHDEIISQCDKILHKKPVVSVNGNASAREGLKRILFLSYAYRITGNKEYASKAIEEMDSVTSLDEWTGEYLGIAELTAGTAIGYDWLYSLLTEEQRTSISDGIVRNGISPSFGPAGEHFLKSVSNWNLVCNTGTVIGSLAVAERFPSLALKTIHRALSSLYMRQYSPDGAYPEGYGYWRYGTDNIVLLIDILQQCFGSDFGLSSTEGFMDTARYMLHLVGNSGKCFNFSDTKPVTVFNPAAFWFAVSLDEPSLLYNERNLIVNGRAGECASYRMAPLAIIWGHKIQFDSIRVPKETVYAAQGVNPIALMRSGWDRDDIYVGFKAGTALAGHAHMDVGSFVIDADGERWATDLGSPKYFPEYFTLTDADSLAKETVLKPEIPYLKVFSQENPRWDVPQANALYHNIITVDGRQLDLSRRAEMQVDGTNASSDLTEQYFGFFSSYKRTISIHDSTYITVTDSMKAAREGKIRWAFVTDAQTDITGQYSVMLSKGGKYISLFLDTDSRSSIRTEKIEAVKPNGFIGECTLISYSFDAAQGEQHLLTARFTPGSKVPIAGRPRETVIATRTIEMTPDWWNFNTGLATFRLPPPPEGAVIYYIDITGDGHTDILRTITADGTPVQWIDDDGDMKSGDFWGDTDNDCLMIDRNRDGIFGSYEDLIIDWIDTDSDGKADIQTVVDNIPYSRKGISGGGHLMLVFDTDNDNVFNYIDWNTYELRCWYHTGTADFYTDYHGNSTFLKIHSTPERLNDIRLNWENPFVFLDPDNDGLTEMTIRLCDSRFKRIMNDDGSSRLSGEIDWAAISMDLDNDNSPENPLDLDLTVNFLGNGNGYKEYRRKFSNLSGLPEADGYFLDPTFRRNEELIFPYDDEAYSFMFNDRSWDSVWFVFDEDDDCKRWERVELYQPLDLYSTGENNGGLDNHRQSDVIGDRGEWDIDNSGKGDLYISPMDGKIHLYGAEWGAWRIDQSSEYYQGMGGIYDIYGPDRTQGNPENFPVVRYEDADGNGFFDRMSMDWNGDGTFDETVDINELGIRDMSERFSLRDKKWKDYSRLFKKAAEGLWRNASEAMGLASDMGIDITWYSFLMHPKSLRQKYDYGFWLQLYLYHDMTDIAAKEGDTDKIMQIRKAYYSNNWKSLK